MRLVVFPLSLHSDPPPITAQDTFNQSHSSLARSQTDSKDPPELPLYISLLREPFAPDAIFTRPLGPRLALPQSSQEFQLTPDTLRFLATHFEELMSHVKEVQIAYNATNRRSSLQQQEFMRQQNKVLEIVQLSEQLKTSRRTQVQEKVERIQNKQKELLNRMEKILREFMKTASPELSEHETKWFEELKRMKQEVVGSTRYDAESLEHRTSLVSRNALQSISRPDDRT